MILIYLSLALALISFFLFKRDKKYLTKDIKDIADDDLKKFLNLPHQEACFSQKLKGSSIQQERKNELSKQILQEMNKK